MYQKSNSYFNSAIYKKAQEIGMLSKHISDYLNTDLASLSENGQENPDIYFLVILYNTLFRCQLNF